MKQLQISLKNVSKKYGRQIVLNKINYDFLNELYVISGVNGSGKSTLVKLITNIVNITTGEIKVNGKIAYLPEKFELPRGMSTVQLLTLYIKNKKEVYQILSDWNIPNRRINSLSKGNFQKLGIVFMLVQNVDTYIFDEPTDSLDVQVVNVFKQAVKYLRDKNKCVIVILHQLNIDELKPIKLKIDGGELCLN